MDRRNFLKTALLATPVAQAAYMASLYGNPNATPFSEQGFGDIIHAISKLPPLNRSGFTVIFPMEMKNELDKYGFKQVEPMQPPEREVGGEGLQIHSLSVQRY